MGEKQGDYDSENDEDEAYILENYEDDEIKAIKKKYRCNLNTWIIKPGENTNRGQGINVS